MIPRANGRKDSCRPPPPPPPKKKDQCTHALIHAHPLPTPPLYAPSITPALPFFLFFLPLPLLLVCASSSISAPNCWNGVGGGVGGGVLLVW